MINQKARVITVDIPEGLSRYHVTVSIKDEDLDNFISYLNLFKNEGIDLEKANG